MLHILDEKKPDTWVRAVLRSQEAATRCNGLLVMGFEWQVTRAAREVVVDPNAIHPATAELSWETRERQ
ncbi:hypothetical protein GCM10007898_19080 [Dyella flagellata]|uniref:Uncharacterized protein n=1 Tax=Dyella flagellata TaxID=1867833 RepID=A0ABQ5XD17_9GAMM|nr:hypothetical protein GCM10007898_19080 [Dyella flagellata]